MTLKSLGAAVLVAYLSLGEPAAQAQFRNSTPPEITKVAAPIELTTGPADSTSELSEIRPAAELEVASTPPWEPDPTVSAIEYSRRPLAPSPDRGSSNSKTLDSQESQSLGSGQDSTKEVPIGLFLKPDYERSDLSAWEILEIVRSEAERLEIQGVAQESSLGTGRIIFTVADAKSVSRIRLPELRRILGERLQLNVELDYKLELPPASLSRTAVQTGASWNLDRLDQLSPNLDNRYNYQLDGSGVEIWVVDSGINPNHTEYRDRVRNFAGIGGDAADCDGHGSHVAGTALGARYGVAKGATLHSVKILDCDGSGPMSGVVDAADFIVQEKTSTVGVVANFSLGGLFQYSAGRNAISKLIQNDVTVVVAAGNDSTDACNAFPANSRVGEISVGATARGDSPAWFTNYGNNCVDIYAPGVDIPSSWIGSTSATRTISGTSMASPLVAGLAARVLQGVPGASPEVVKYIIQAQASNFQSGKPNDANLFAHRPVETTPAALDDFFADVEISKLESQTLAIGVSDFTADLDIPWEDGFWAVVESSGLRPSVVELSLWSSPENGQDLGVCEVAFFPLERCEVDIPPGPVWVDVRVSNALGWGDPLGSRLEISPIATSGDWTMVASYWNSSCGVQFGTDIYCWGIPFDGAGSRTSQPEYATAELVFQSDLQVTSLDLSDYHACFTLENGDAYCWGSNSRGQLGQSSTSLALSETPVKVQHSIPGGFKKIVAGLRYTCATSQASSIYCWGGNTYGQLGTGDRNDRSAPTLSNLATGTSVKNFDLGDNHSCALTQNSEVRCVGADYMFASGGSGQDYLLEARRVASGNFDYIATGADFSCVANSYSAYCWGANGDGQIGQGSRGGLKYASNVDFQSVSTSATPSIRGLVAASDGACLDMVGEPPICWGKNAGKYFDWTTTTWLESPTSIGLSVPGSISLGSSHLCLLSEDGALLCAGNNSWGQLGRGFLSSSELLDKVDAPSAPSIPESISVDRLDGGLLVSWSRPSDLGFPISTISYQVTVFAESDPETVAGTCLTSQLSCEIVGLTNGESYGVVLSVSNDVGSRSSEVIYATPSTFASPPVIEEVSSIQGGFQAFLSEGESNGGSEVVLLKIEAVNPDSNRVEGLCEISSVTDLCTISGLRDGRFYLLAAYALNAAGWGSASDAWYVSAGKELAFPQTDPVVKGDAAVGETLVVDAGDWPDRPRLSYQWYYWDPETEQVEPINRATRNSYRLASSDIGRILFAEITASKPGFATTFAYSNDVGPVATGFSRAPEPTLTGTAAMGETLTLNLGDWSPEPELFEIGWYRVVNEEVQAIAVEDRFSYTLQAEDINSQIFVEVTASKENYLTTTRSSALTELVQGLAFEANPQVDFFGIPSPGETLLFEAWNLLDDAAYVYELWVGDQQVAADDYLLPVEYLVTDADEGKSIRFIVTGSKLLYSDAVAELEAGPVGKAYQNKIPVVVIEGDAAVGETLSVDAGNWPDRPRLSYQWYYWDLDTGTEEPINRATRNSYRISSSDVGKFIFVKVTVTKRGFATLELWSDNLVGPAATGFSRAPEPTLTGTAAMGETLTLNLGDWSPEPELFEIGWYRVVNEEVQAIAVEDRFSYTLQAEDINSQIFVEVTASKENYLTTTRSSALTELVQGLAFEANPQVDFFGIPSPGETLLFEAWNLLDDAAYVYELWVGDQQVAADDYLLPVEYLVTDADEGKSIRFIVTGSKLLYSDAVAELEAGPVGKAYQNKIPVVVIEGDAAVGETLSVDAGNWPDRPRLSYQWYYWDLDTGTEEPINRATRNSYRISSSDVGKFIFVKVTVTKRGFATLELWSDNLVGPAATGFSRAPEPTLTGTAAMGETLTLNLGDWSPEPELFEIGWYRVVNEEVQAIAVEDRFSYTLQAEDINSQIFVEVTASKENYLTTTRSSALTELVQGLAFEANPQVDFFGIPSPGETLLFEAWNLLDDAAYVYELWVGDQQVAADDYLLPVEYLVTDADEGKSIRFIVTGSKLLYSDAVAELEAGPVGKAYQNKIPVVVIEGDAAVGETLSVDAGNWPDRPRLSYQWYYWDLDTGTEEPINRATRNSYRISSSDVGKFIFVKVTVTKRGFATLELWSDNLVGPAATGFSRAPEPTLTGTAAMGETLTLNLGDWSPEPELFEIGWYRVVNEEVQAIAVEDRFSYTLQAEDINSQIFVEVTASKENYLTTTRSSALTELVQGLAFEANPQVDFFGIPSPGETLLFEAWNLLDDAAYVYELWVGDQQVAADDYLLPVEYLVTDADEGKSIRFIVTGSKLLYSDAVAELEAGPVGKAYQNKIPVVVIEGDAAVGETLSVDAGNWPDRPRLSYQWYYWDLDTGTEEPINRATRNSYRISSSDVGKFIFVKVTVTKRGFATLELWSDNLVGPAATGFSRAPEPTLTGTAAMGETLTLNLGDWSPEPELFEIGWYRVVNEEVQAIAVEDRFSYTLQAEDINSQIFVEVTASKENYLTTTRSSALTELVQGLAFEANPQVDFFGIPSPGETLLFEAWNLLDDAAYVYELWVGDQQVAADDYLLPVEYLVTDADEGKSIRFIVTGSKLLYSDAVAELEAGPVGKAYQNKIPVVVIEGDAAVGETLSVDAGNWPDRPRLSYQWYYWDLDTGTEEPINRATRNSYRISSSDVGKFIFVKVTVTKRGFATLELWSDNLVGPAATGFSRAPEPTLTGTAAMGETLTLNLGDWSPEPELFEIGWYRVVNEEVQAIAVEDRFSYTLQAEDINSQIFVEVTASKENYLTTTRSSALTELVQGLAFEANPQVDFFGIPSPGETLLFEAWNLLDDAAYVYELWVGDQQVAADDYLLPVEYLVTDADEGKSIRFIVTGSKLLYSDAVAELEAGPVGKAYQNKIPVVVIEGDAAVGETLSVDAGNWPDRPRLSYQWYYWDLDTGTEEPINRATRNSYRISSSDVGKFIFVKVTVTKRGFATLELWSDNLVGPAATGFSRAPEPTLTGTAAMGETLTLNLGDWSPEPELFEIGWYRVVNEEVQAIAVEDRFSYTLQAEDINSQIFVEVTASKENYLTTTRSSALTELVQGLAFEANPQVDFFGIPSPGETLLFEAWNLLDDAAYVYELWVGDQQVAADDYLLPVEYLVTDADEGKSIRFIVTGSKLLYSDAVAELEAGPVGKAYQNKIPVVVIEGDAAVGETLSVDAGNWPDRPRLSYQWYYWDLDTGTEEPINRATRNSYRISSSDVGKFIFVKVTVTKRGYATLYLYSENDVGPVGLKPQFISSGQVVGTVQYGGLLSIEGVEVDGTPAPEISLSWHLCPTSLRNPEKEISQVCSDSLGATEELSLSGANADQEGYYYVQISASSTAGTTLAYAYHRTRLLLPALTFDLPFNVFGVMAPGWTLSSTLSLYEGLDVTYTWQDQSQNVLGNTSTLELTSAMVGSWPELVAKVSAPGYKSTELRAKAPGELLLTEFVPNSGTTVDGVYIPAPSCQGLRMNKIPYAVVGWQTVASSNTNTPFTSLITQRIYNFFADAEERENWNNSSYFLKEQDIGKKISRVMEFQWSNGLAFRCMSVLEQVVTDFQELPQPLLQLSGNQMSISNITNFDFEGAEITWYVNFVEHSKISIDGYAPLSLEEVSGWIQAYIEVPGIEFATTRISTAIFVGESGDDLADPYALAISQLGTNQPAESSIEFFTSPNVPPERIAKETEQLKHAEGAWADYFSPSGVQVMYFTPQDIDWAVEFVSANGWNGAGNLTWRLENWGCGFALAFLVDGLQKYLQCVDDAGIGSDWHRQVGPHEYTHWVQFHLDPKQIMSTARAPYFLIEGSANFFGLALSQQTEGFSREFMDLTLAQHASQMDLLGFGQFGDLTLLKILAQGNLLEVESLVEKNWTVYEAYAWGSLITEWMILQVGVDGMATFWSDIGSIVASDAFTSGPTYRALLDEVWTANFGYAYTELGDKLLPYLAWRAPQLIEAWENSRN